MPELDLSLFLAKSGLLFAQELKNNVRGQKDIDGSNFIPVKQSTAISRQMANNARVREARGRGVTNRVGGNRKIIKIGGLSRERIKRGLYAKTAGLDYKRLLFTGNFADGAFVFTPHKDHVVVSVNDSYYSLRNKTLVTYKQIVQWNNAGSPQVNRKILKPPLIFPKNEGEVRKMKAWGQTVKLFNSSEVKNSIEQQMFQNALGKTVVNLSIG